MGSAAVGLASAAALSTTQAARKGKFPLIVSTWPFGKPANEVALKVLLQDNGSILDAVERRDAEKARDAMRAHLSQVREDSGAASPKRATGKPRTH